MHSKLRGSGKKRRSVKKSKYVDPVTLKHIPKTYRVMYQVPGTNVKKYYNARSLYASTLHGNPYQFPNTRIEVPLDMRFDVYLAATTGRYGIRIANFIKSKSITSPNYHSSPYSLFSPPSPTV